MAELDDNQPLVRRYLDPGERLAEVLFGLIMVLTFTLTAGFAIGESPDARRELLIAALGCNVAWGFIDGGLYIMGAMHERARRAMTLMAVQRAPTEAEALSAIAESFDHTLAGRAPEAERLRFYRSVRELAIAAPRPERTGILRDDVMGAVGCFLLVVVSLVPAALPFAVIEDAHTALRVSNALLIGMLFLTGLFWGRNSNTNPWMAGLVYMLVGLAMVGIAIALGG